MADLTYRQLKAAVETLAKETTRDAEAILCSVQMIEADAKDTARVAEMIAALGVDPATVAETHDLARVMTGFSEVSVAYVFAGDNTAKSASAAATQAQTTHSGIQEAYSRATVNLSSLYREWLTQE